MENNQIQTILLASAEVKQTIARDQQQVETIRKAAETIAHSFRNGGRVYFCGNGGSAADAQHLAAEFSGKFYKDRAVLPSEALHTNSSYLTAVGNDYGYEEVYARLASSFSPHDVLVGLSTSGNSTNIVRAFEVCRARKVTTIGMTGKGGGKMQSLSDIWIEVPSNDTPRIQEAHITIGHIICQLVEEMLF
ncbi:D-sedoheptulose-7-phosphate isomerase [Microbacter margulisiae]|uniref:Phosphoheptose isomerase n=1 Tax=Microbacter margulisiae TaxID=1350067 RepID=A0A7W5H3E5_9PORP|nr:SIS domain-containing protein [Microbacter margulisiae]MBB3188750.1 D-sedoheptulose 7-phosphate isomerase [Microbacter margulisiae]